MISAPARPSTARVSFEQPSLVMAPSFLARSQAQGVSMISLVTLVLWASCMAVGVLGLLLHYQYPQLPVVKPPLQAELLNVELTNDPLPLPERAEVPPATLVPPPPMPEKLIPPPQAPALTAVAEPSPAIAFPLPVPGPVQIVEARQAVPVREPVPEEKAPVPAYQPKRLTFGHGEGRQPAPVYPLQAQRQGQEGVVGVRFTVGEHRRVLAAEASSPSPWPLLNREAVRTIRERWNLPPGYYEVAIRFELQK